MAQSTYNIIPIFKIKKNKINQGQITKNALGYIRHRIEVVTRAKGNHLLVNLRTTLTCHYLNPGLHR